MKSSQPHPRLSERGGFALVITVMLMVVLVVLAVGLLTLSAVSLRVTGQGAARAEAQANARLALALAFAQLQKQTGPDTRITAPADFLAPDDPAKLANTGWRGVWRSNKDTPTSYEPARSDFFNEWLVTTADQALTMDAAGKPLQGLSTIIRQTAGLPDVRIPLLEIPNHGLLGWWTDDESLKARADFPVTEGTTTGDMLSARHAPSRLGPGGVPGVVGFTPTPANAAGLITPSQLTLAAETWPDRQGGQFTTYSQSVMADVRKGGLKQDLSALFEQKTNNIPDIQSWQSKPATAAAAASFLYGGPAPAVGGFAVMNGTRWKQLFNYYNLYKDVSFKGDEPRISYSKPLIDWHNADGMNATEFGDEAGGFRFPRFVKVMYTFSYSSIASPNPANPLETYKLRLSIDTIITLWNPFDVRIVFPANMEVYMNRVFGDLPLNFEWRVNDKVRGVSRPTAGNLNGKYFSRPGSGSLFTMAPGETVVFSLPDSATTPPPIKFKPGRFFNGDVVTDGLATGGGKIFGKAGDKVSVGLKAEDINQGTSQGMSASQYMDLWIKDTQRGWPFFELRGEIIASSAAALISRMPPVKSTSVPSWAFNQVVGLENKQPFAAFIMETKTASESLNPVPAFLTTGNLRTSSRLGSDAGQFVHEHLEYKLEPVMGMDSDLLQVSLPSNPAGPDHGFIGSGRGPSTGQTSFLAASVPTLPLTSLAQFRHAGTGDGAASNRATQQGEIATPYPPFADQAIGNSYAHPLVKADSTGAVNKPGIQTSALLDHRYLGNEALWDGYFLSSLAPRSAAYFGKTSSMAESWTTFLQGSSKLINPRFSPWLGGEAADDVRKRFFASSSADIAKDGYRRIAANLMLDGGFNVNSTSVDAWHAFLASTRKTSLTRLPLNGGFQGQRVTSSGALFSRTDTVLSDAVDKDPGNLAAHYSGYRDLTDEKLHELAEQVVIQIRKRGPFLNMAEFINRRLSNDTDLALCGALQAAIDKAGLNDAVRDKGVATSGSPGGATMAFPKASQLGTAAGNPGWLMQGDVLDPLGSALVARGDTFRIRAYGASRNAQGVVAANAWCEAVVQRVPAYIDTSETAEVAVPAKTLNKLFGRRYQLISFRWLSGPDA